MVVKVDGQLYCYNTESEMLGRCREGIPGECSCHPGEQCFCVGSYEKYEPNCAFGYFSQNDANNFCKDLGGRLLNESEMDDSWPAISICNPPKGRYSERCY